MSMPRRILAREGGAGRTHVHSGSASRKWVCQFSSSSHGFLHMNECNRRIDPETRAIHPRHGSRLNKQRLANLERHARAAQALAPRVHAVGWSERETLGLVVQTHSPIGSIRIGGKQTESVGTRRRRCGNGQEHETPETAKAKKGSERWLFQPRTGRHAAQAPALRAAL